MALAPRPADLWDMFRLNPSNREVREARSHYGPGSPEPERFPAELVLRDLGAAHGEAAAPLILARYAVLRAWHLSGTSPESHFLDHAQAAALAHLAAIPATWPEGTLLRRLMDGVMDPRMARGEAAALLLSIAAAAEEAGHIDSALAARTTAWTAELRGWRLAGAADVAAGIATFLRRQGAARRAEEWDGVAARLVRVSGGWLPPSPS
jgi:hypothetical protein